MKDTKKLQYFVGKVCTVFTHPINRDFKTESPDTYPRQLLYYFLGLVESVDDDGIMLRQISSNQRTFLYHLGIIGIAEEQVLDPSKEEDAKTIENMRPKIETDEADEELKRSILQRQNSQRMNITESKSKYVNPADMSEILRQAREMADSSPTS